MLPIAPLVITPGTRPGLFAGSVRLSGPSGPGDQLIAFLGRYLHLLGRRRMLMIGLFVFTAASLACGLAATDSFLIPMRCVQGLGAAIMLPAALSIVMNMFPEGAERNKALGVWGAIGASGATVGLISSACSPATPAGSTSSSSTSRSEPRRCCSPRAWCRRSARVRRGAPALRPVRRGRGDRRAVPAGLRDLDRPAGRVERARTVSLLAVSVVLLAAFLVIETRVEAPLMPLRIFGNKTLAGANAVSVLLGGSFFAFIFIGTLYTQQVLGYSALKAGLAWLATSLTSVAFAGLSQALVTRGWAKLVMAAGMAMIGGGVLWATQVTVHGHFWASLAGPFVIVGIGTAFAFIPVSIAALAGVAEHGRPGLRAPQHLPAARRGDRRRDSVHHRRHPGQHPAPPGRRTSRGTDQRLPVGVVGLRPDRPGRRPGHVPPGPPQRAGQGSSQHSRQGAQARPRRCRVSKL